MNINPRVVALGVALATSLALPLTAEDQSDFAFKLRAGSVSGSVTKNSLGHRNTGIAVEYTLPTPVAGGHITAELGYENFNGYRRETTDFKSQAYYATNQDPFHPTGISTTYSPAGSAMAYPIFLDPAHSLQAESMVFRGFTGRVGYNAPVPLQWAQGWNWQGGLTLDRRETHHEVFMTLAPVYLKDGAYNVIPPQGYKDPYYYEGANYSKNKAKLYVGAYVGLKRSFSDIFSFEMNLRHTTFNEILYKSFTVTGQPTTYQEKTSYGVVLEFSLGVKL